MKTGNSKRLVILTYHRVVADDPLKDPDEIDEQQFRMHVATLSRFFNVLKLSDAISGLRNGGLPGRAVAITFDDGYKDNVTAALPILEHYGVPATFFIATGFLDGGIMWNDIVIESVKRFEGETIDLDDFDLGSYPAREPAERIAAYRQIVGKLRYQPQEKRDVLCRSIAEHLEVRLPTDLMMSSADLATLRNAGMEVGAHTRSHPILAVVPEDDARREIVGSKRDVEQIVGAEVKAFAYPNGRPGQDYKDCHVDMVRDAGFELAVSTAAGCVGAGADVFQLGRVSVWHRSRPKLVLRMLKNYFLGEPARA